VTFSETVAHRTCRSMTTPTDRREVNPRQRWSRNPAHWRHDRLVGKGTGAKRRLFSGRWPRCTQVKRGRKVRGQNVAVAFAMRKFGERARGSVWALSRFPLVNYLLVASRAQAWVPTRQSRWACTPAVARTALLATLLAGCRTKCDECPARDGRTRWGPVVAAGTGWCWSCSCHFGSSIDDLVISCQKLDFVIGRPGDAAGALRCGQIRRPANAVGPIHDCIRIHGPGCPSPLGHLQTGACPQRKPTLHWTRAPPSSTVCWRPTPRSAIKGPSVAGRRSWPQVVPPLGWLFTEGWLVRNPNLLWRAGTTAPMAEWRPG